MACRILRAPGVAQSISRNTPNLSQCLSYAINVKTKCLGTMTGFQKRSYNNYKTSGELAALKDPSDGTVFTEEAAYPEILDMEESAVSLRKRQLVYDEIKKVPTAFHKMYLINAERGREDMFYVGDLHYNSLALYQYATRTKLKMEESITETASETIDPSLVSFVEDAILANSSASSKHAPSAEAEERKNHDLVRSIIDAIRFNNKLTDTAIIEKPRLEAFWQHPSFRTNNDENRFGDSKTFGPWFQFAQTPEFMISSDIPLRPIIATDSSEIFGSDFPTYDYFPEEFGMFTKKHHLVSTPGYWCCVPQYPLLTVSSLKKVFPISLDPSINTDHLNASERRRQLAAHGLMMNFAAANAAASNCGFTVYHEVTYPFVAQNFVTDGQTWHISKYQLNTMAFGPDFAQDKQNFAWSSEEMKLYESVENGKVHGLNKTVLSRLVDVVNASRELVENPRPYVEELVENEFRERGERLFKDMASRKFHHKEHLTFEVPLWVKLYKMNEDAPPTPNLKWERPRRRALHIFQFNKEIYDEEIKQEKEKLKRIKRDRLYGLYIAGRHGRHTIVKE